MKYVVWVSAFVAYLLVFTGVFSLLSSITKGFEVEIKVEREVYGEIIIRTQTVEFNEVPIVKMVFGITGLFITMSGGYLVANSLGSAWGSEEKRKTTRIEKLLLSGIFVCLFGASSYIFNIYSILDLFGIMGVLFMAITCAGTYIATSVYFKMTDGRRIVTAPEMRG